MSPIDSTLAAIYNGWEAYQGHLTNAMKPLTPEQLALRAAPNLRSIFEQMTHVIAVRVRWFHNAADAGGSEVEPFAAWDRANPPAQTAAELVRGLKVSWQLIRDSLAIWTPADLETPFEKTRGGEVHTLTRQWIIWHVIEHDLHHGGEVSFVLGMHGLAGLDI
jgi:uncharacterized damage-inducible protein DinB